MGLRMGDGHGQGTTDCVQDREELRARAEQTLPELLIDLLPYMFVVVDRQYRLIRWNRHFQAASEYSDQELASMSILDVVVDGGQTASKDAMRWAYDDHTVQTSMTWRTKSGKTLPVFTTCQRIMVAGVACVAGIGWDATQHKLTELLLADEQHVLSTLIDNLPDAVYIKDRDSRFVLCNREVLRRKGVGSLSEIVGRSDFDFCPSDLARSVYSEEQDVMRTGHPIVNKELCVVDRVSGQPTWNLTTKVPLRNAAGEIVGIVGIGRDVTQRKEVEEAYHAIVDHSLQGLVVIQDMRVVFVNRAMTQISGYTVDEILSISGGQLQEFIHPLDREAVWRNHRTRLSGEPLPDQYEFRIIRKDGSVRWVEIITSRIDYQGRPAIQAACIDVTERHRAQEALRRSEARHMALLNANPDLMFRLTRGGVFLDCKPPKDDAVSASPAQFVGKHLDEVFPASTARSLMQLIQTAIDTGEVQTLEYSLARAEDESCDFECRLVACAEQEVVAIVRDISDRRRAAHLAKLQRDMAIRLSSLSDLKEGLQYCLEVAIKTSGMDSGGIYILDEHTGGLRLEAHLGLPEDFIAEVSAYPANSRNAQVIMRGEPVYASQERIGAPVGPAQKAERLLVIGVVPIRHEDRVVACLNVGSHRIEEVSPRSRAILETIAAQIGSAISRLKVQDALQRAEREKATILNAMRQIVTYHDVSHRLLWANQVALDALHMTVEEIVGRRCYELWEGSDLPCKGCPVDLALRTGSPQEMEIVGYNGGTWLVRGEPVRDDAGGLLGVVELAIDITRRKQNEEELRRRLRFEGLIADISTDLANLPTDRIEEGVERTLAGIGQFIQADRCFAHLFEHGDTTTSRVCEWDGEGIDRAVEQNLDVETKGALLDAHMRRSGGVLHIRAVGELEGAEIPIKEFLESISVKSILCVPIAIEGDLLGILGVTAVREQRVWPGDAESMLKTAAEILANALERKRASDAMRERLAFETLLSELSATFINLPAGQVDGEIERWLARIGGLLGVDRGTVVQVFGSAKIVTHSWAAPGIKTASPSLTVVDFEWSLSQVREDGVFACARVKDIPAAGEKEKAYYEREDIQSIITLPLKVAGSMLGTVSFSSMRVSRSWSNDLVQRLRLVGEVFANAMLRCRAEEALRASETQLRSLFRAVPAGIGFLHNRVMLEINDGLCVMTGYRREELINQDARMLYPTEEEYEHVGQAYQRIYEQGSGVIEGRWRHKDGRIMNVLLHGTPLDPSDRTKGIIFATLDITEQKKAEEELRESERNYHEIFNASNDCIFIYDAATADILDVNRTVLETYGYTSEEARHLRLENTHAGEPPYTHENALAWIRKAVEEGPQRFEWHSRMKNGELFWEEVNLQTAVLRGQRCVLAVERDITDRKKGETLAQEHLAELTRAWHANTLGEMASGLAHELNQPLCAIVNFSSGCLRLTRKKDYSMETVRNTIEQIATQAQRAADIIKRIRALVGKHDLQRTVVDLESVLTDTIHMLREEAIKHNVAIISRLEADLPRVKGDSVEIEQVVLNLMRNAIEAMSDERIAHRKLTISSRSLNSQHVEVSVADTGRGISPELAEKIFESFFTTKSQGLGIGLSLSTRIVEAHGGRLWVESDGRSGATFRFTLPVEGATHGER
ncbi:MAG: PAS domain S-box protein [Solirubrobacterales bacterium]